MKRIQRKRVKGWRMPPNTIYVGRPSEWGNPFVVGGYYMKGDIDQSYRGPFRMIYTSTSKEYADSRFTLITTPEQAVEWFEWYMSVTERSLKALYGKDLACWCSLCHRHKDGKPFHEACADCPPCHADIEGRLANPVSEGL